jgi:ribonuclease Z
MSTEVVITGTGVPHVAPGRAGPGVLIRHEGTALQFDAGRATSLRLAEAGTRHHELDALFVTHHHSDHLTGLVDLLFTRWLEGHGRHVPLEIVAPEGPSTRFLERMLDPWQDDIAIRMEHAGRADRPDPRIARFEAPGAPSLVWENAAVRVLACAVHHEPVTPAVAYRVETPDGAVVISGDTVVCAEVEKLARNANVLVHEAFRRAVVLPFRERLPHLASISAYHADTAEIGPLAARAGVDTLVLTHLIPAPSDEKQVQGFVDDVRAGGYEGTLIVAEDLTAVRF